MTVTYLRPVSAALRPDRAGGCADKQDSALGIVFMGAFLLRRSAARHWAGLASRHEFGDATGGLMSFGIGIAKRFALTPEQGAKTTIYLASSKEVAGVSGEYFHECRAIAPSPAAQDDAAARRLWEETTKLVFDTMAKT